MRWGRGRRRGERRSEREEGVCGRGEKAWEKAQQGRADLKRREFKNESGTEKRLEERERTTPHHSSLVKKGES